MLIVLLSGANLVVTYSQAIIIWLALISAIGTLGWLVANKLNIPPAAGSLTKSHELHRGISMHRLQVGGGIAGLLFTIACSVIFLGRIPALRYFFAASILLGIGLAVVFSYRGRS